MTKPSIPVLSLIVAFCIILSALPAIVPGTAIVAPLLDRPVDVETSPSVRVMAHGVHSPLRYRVTIEVANRFTSDSLHISAPEESLSEYLDPETGDRVFNGEPTDDGDIWVTYDTTGEQRYPVRRMKTAWTRPMGEAEEQAVPDTKLDFQQSIELLPNTITAVDLDFVLPRRGEVPRRVTLNFKDAPMGEGVVLDKRLLFQIQGRGALRYLNGVLGAWYRQAPTREEVESANKSAVE